MNSNDGSKINWLNFLQRPAGLNSIFFFIHFLSPSHVSIFPYTLSILLLWLFLFVLNHLSIAIYSIHSSIIYPSRIPLLYHPKKNSMKNKFVLLVQYIVCWLSKNTLIHTHIHTQTQTKKSRPRNFVCRINSNLKQI